MPGRNDVPLALRLRVAMDVRDRNGLTGGDKIILTQQLAPTSYGHLTEDELETLIRLLQKASIAVDAHGG